MHPGIAIAKALPARLFDQPASGQLHLPVRLWITHQPRMLLPDLGRQSSGHHWVLEETAGIAQYRRVRQFFAADAANGATDITGRRLLDALLAQTLAHRAIFQV